MLSEPNYPPTFSVIDVSFNGYTKEEEEANSNDLTGKNASVKDGDVTNTSTTTDTVEMKTTAMTTALPAIVIGFASSIVLCGLFLVASEFLERRKFNKRMETTMIQLSSSASGSGSGSGNLSSQSLKLVAWDEKRKQFRVISTDSSGSVYGGGADESNARIGIHRQIRHEESRNSKDYIPTTTVARIYASSDQSSLYYDESYPSDEGEEESDHQYHHDQHHDQHHNHDQHQHRRSRDDRFSHHHIVIDDMSLTDVSTMTTSLRFDNINVINTPIYDDDDNNHNSEKVTELSDIHRVSDDTKIESLVNLSTIPATKFVSLSSSSSQQQQQIQQPKAVTTAGPTEESTMKENKEEHAANISIAVQQLSESTVSTRRHTLSSFDAGIITTTSISPITSIPEVMADSEDEDDDNDDYNDDDKQLSSNIRSVSEEDESGWSSTIDKSDIDTYSDEDDISIGNKICRSIQGLESSNNKSSTLLGEGCLIAMKKNNGYTVLETEYKIQEKVQQKRADRCRLTSTTSNNQEGREDVDSLVLSCDDTSNTKSTAEYRTHPDYSYSGDDDDDMETGVAPPTNPALVDKSSTNDDPMIDCILVDNNGFHALRKDTTTTIDNDDDDTTHESSTTTRTPTESNYYCELSAERASGSPSSATFTSYV